MFMFKYVSHFHRIHLLEVDTTGVTGTETILGIGDCVSSTLEISPDVVYFVAALETIPKVVCCVSPATPEIPLDLVYSVVVPETVVLPDVVSSVDVPETVAGVVGCAPSTPDVVSWSISLTGG